jgi:hypothetical protein
MLKVSLYEFLNTGQMPYKSKLLVGAIGPVDVWYARIGDLESIESGPGWYAWFYVPSSLQESAYTLHRFCHPKAVVEGLFNLDLDGWLSPVTGKSMFNKELQQDENFLAMVRSLVLAFSPPLYIGISTKLRRRLKTHRAQLLEALSSGISDLKSQHNIPDYSPDTDEESRCFGSRMGAYLNALSIPHEDLYVKYILTERADFLKDAEKILNHTLTPKFGKR